MVRASKLLVVPFVGLATCSFAGLTTYANEGSWTAAVGSVDATEDFSGFAVDTSFRDAPVALNGGMSIVKMGSGGSDSRNFIDVTPFLFPDPASNHAEIQLQDSASTPAAVRIDFTGANRAFGFKTWYASGALAAGTTVEVYDGATMLGDFDLTDGAGDFAGYALDGGDTATHVVFRAMREGSNLLEGFALDDLQVASVPEPATLAALALGLASLKRRRR